MGTLVLLNLPDFTIQLLDALQELFTVHLAS